MQTSMRVAKTARLGKKEVLGHVRDVDQRFLVKHGLEVLDASQVQCGGSHTVPALQRLAA